MANNTILFFGDDKNGRITELVHSLTRETKQTVNATCKKDCMLTFDRNFNEHDFKSESCTEFEELCKKLALLGEELGCDMAFDLCYEQTVQKPECEWTRKMRITYDTRKSKEMYISGERHNGEKYSQKYRPVKTYCNVYLYGFDESNKQELEKKVFAFTPYNIMGDCDKFWDKNLENVGNGVYKFSFGEGPFWDYEFEEYEDEGEDLSNPYFVQFEKFCADVAKLGSKIGCDIAFDFNFEYARKSKTGVSEMSVWYDSKKCNKLNFTRKRLAGSWSVGHYFPEEFQ